MTPRPHPSRAVVLLLALLSMVAFGDYARETCEMHGGIAGEAIMRGVRQSSMSMADMHDMGAGARMAPHDAQLDRDGRSDEQDSDDCCCTCIGSCSVGAAVATLPIATTVRVATVTAERRHAPDAQRATAPPASADRRLPYPNGPPATRLS